MGLGILKLKLYIPHSSSLKDKRRVIRSLITKLRENFNVSVAEIDDHDRWQVANLAIACLAPDKTIVEQTLSKVKEFALNNRLDALVLEEELEIHPGP